MVEQHNPFNLLKKGPIRANTTMLNTITNKQQPAEIINNISCIVLFGSSTLLNKQQLQQQQEQYVIQRIIKI